ncbi:MAG: acyl-CoA dehydrogenase family protein [Gemmatimonadetes bacterium]|nr:acyl-CoA dehydrogenase family protein [Gemmatimonadota bacterium]
MSHPDRSEASTPAPPRPSPAVDVAALRAALDGAQHGTRDFVRQRLTDPRFAYQYGLSSDAYREQVLAWLRELAKDGLGALAVPPALGGKGDPAAFMAAFETLAFHDLSLTIKFGVQFGLFQGSVQLLGTAWHHETFLPAISRGELLGVFAMSELGSGSNVRDLETLATYDPASEEFVIHTPHPGAHKEWLGNAARHGRMATVFAQLVTPAGRHGVHAFLVPIRDERGEPMPGVRIGDTGLKEGLNGVDNGRLWFDRVRIPRSHLLDRFGQVAPDGTYTSPIESPARRFFTMIGTLVGGRITIGLSALSAAKSALTIAVRYGNRRRQFGPDGGNTTPLLDYRTHQRRLLPALATSIVLDFALSQLVDRFTALEGESDRELEGLAAGLKAYTAWFAQGAITDARECCGGQGYLQVNRIAVLRGDIDVWCTFEGDNTVLYQLLAKALLTEYKQEFADMGVIRLLTRRARARLRAMNPIAARRDDEDHLRDPDQQLALLRYREERILDAAARRLRHALAKDPERAMSEVQDHLMHLATAHVERVAFEAVQREIERAGPSLAPLLALLRDTFWASRVDADIGWFLMTGVVETPKAKAIRYLANKCCQELRPIAETVTEGFGIPDAVLAAPIAFDPLPTADA